MTTTLTLQTTSSFLLPPALAGLGEDAAKAFIDFFTAQIRNANTRAAYTRCVGQFLAWLDERNVCLSGAEPFHVAAYVEQLGQTAAKATVKQHLAAIRKLGDFLVIRQVLKRNPATEVRGPKHVVRTGKTPAMTGEEARALLESIDATTPIGLRDRALIGVMIYTFGRVSAVLGLDVADYHQVGRRMMFSFEEKGGVDHAMPAHHSLIEYMDAYLMALGADGGPLFRTINRTRTGYTDNRLNRREALAMVKRRCRAAGLGDRFTNHTFRASGITAYLKNGGDIKQARFMAAHASCTTTELYDRREQEATLDEVERIIL